MNVGFFVAALTVWFATGTPAATPVLRVNGMPVTDVELNLALQALQEMPQGKEMDGVTRMRHALDQLIARALLLQAARAAGVTAEPQMAEKALAAQAAQMGGEEAFARSMAQAQLDRATLLRIAEERHIIARYVDQVLLAGVEIRDEQALAYYQANPEEFRHPPQLKLRIMHVAVAPGASSEEVERSRARLAAAAARVRAGEDFAAVAKEVSSDATAPQGGDLGWVSAGQLLAELESPVWALKVGELSDLLRAPSGFFLFRLEDRRGEGMFPFAEIKESLKGYLRQRMAPAVVQAKVDALRREAKIEGIAPEVRRALAASGQ